MQRGIRADLFARSAAALYFQVKPITAKFLPALEATLCLVVAAACQAPADIALETARKHDQSLQHFAIQPGSLQHRSAALLTFEIRARH